MGISSTSFSGQIKYNFIHTINNKGLPDTLTIDPLLTYDIVIHTLPPVKVDSVKLVAGKHTIVAAQSPQGFLKLKVGNNDRTVKDLRCVVRLADSSETLNIQQFGPEKKYLIGTYDLEILSLPRIKLTDVEISQSHTTTVEIPQPGIVVIQKSVNGYGSLYVERDNRLEWIFDLRDNLLQESLVLQPGQYRVIFRSKYMNQSFYTIDRPFIIESGSTTNLKLFRR